MILRVKPLTYTPYRRYAQALLANKRRGKHKSSVDIKAVSPRWRLKDRNEIEENLKRRGLENAINVPDLYKQWEIFQNSESRKVTILERQSELLQLIANLKSAATLSAEEKTSLQSYAKERRELSIEYESSRDIRKDFLDIFLTLPNKLLPNTPDEPQIVLDFGQNLSTNPCKHHLSYDHLIDYYSDKAFYLRNDAAKFDIAFPIKCLDYFRCRGFTQFNNPDFSKTVIVEGAAVPLENLYKVEHSTNESSNLVHLVGGGSWLSFMGFIAEYKFEEEQLPMQLISVGRSYRPTEPNDLGLFDVAQSSMVQVFLAGTEKEMDKKFNETLDLMIQMFKAIDIHFRVVYVPANQLELAECFAARIEMFSPHLKIYIEIGRLSYYQDHISKRVRFECDRKREKFPRVLGGTVCNVTKLLAIILETHNGNIPNTIFANNFLK